MIKNMKKILLIILPFVLVILSGCGTLSTRNERDIYTITDRDTTTFAEVKNAPGNRDNSIIFPSSRTFTTNRNVTQRDSLIERAYPNFIRLGVFESLGLIGGDKNHALGTGMFGIFPEFDKFKNTYQGDSSKLFTGGIYRLINGEWRLRWFKDSPNWTLGTSAVEIIAPDARLEKTLVSFLPLYIRKRFYLSESIPYLSLAPYFGIGWFPSQYINIGGELELGSLGGLSIRAYVGFAGGFNTKSSAQVVNSLKPNEGQVVMLPYAGLGLGFADFINIVPETYKEWKDHQHSSWDIGLIQASFLFTGADSSFIDSKDNKAVFTGMMMRLLNTAIALPVLNNKFYIGTSLANIVVLGRKEYGIGILPLRLGYWQTIIEDELTTEPFFEMNYYPSSFIHIGNRVNLRLMELLNLGVVMGYASGSTTSKMGRDIIDMFGPTNNFSRFYIGISLGVGDRVFLPEEIRYNKK